MLHKALKAWFGFDHFNDGQEEIITSVLKNQPTLGILPTGSGKSLCYQLPTYIKQQPTLIVSPLISLMDDQVSQMKANGESSVSRVHSGMDAEEKRQNIDKLSSSRFIFLSPEFLLHGTNINLIKNINLGMIVLDEAHCLSEWGYDFRPHYALIRKVTKYFPQATLLALTATAQPFLISDLNDMLDTKFHQVKTSMNRDNIMLSHKNFSNDDDKLTWLLPFIEHSGPTIIYVSSKKMCATLARAIYNHGFLTGIYHGDMSYQERHTVQHQFINNEIPVIVATSAFGMGINKKDIRTIIHYHLPTSPSNYFQEIGRAGRDGTLSQAISLYQPDDSYLLETLLFTDAISETDIQLFEIGELIDSNKYEILTVLNEAYSIQTLKRIFNTVFQRKQLSYYRMLGYINLDQCRRKYLLEFFGDRLINQPAYCCDIDSKQLDIKQLNRKKVKRKMDYLEKLQSLFK